jgi:hypothetical protein
MNILILIIVGNEYFHSQIRNENIRNENIRSLRIINNKNNMNKIQSEAQLENNLISQLQGLEYDFVTIKNEKDLLENLKKQIEKHNAEKLDNKKLSEKEFIRVLNHLDK